MVIKVKVAFRHRNEAHLPVQPAEKRKIRHLRINGIIRAVIHQNSQQVFSLRMEVWRQIRTEGGKSAFMARRLLPVEIYFADAVCALALQVEMAAIRRHGSLQRAEIPAGATVIIASAILSVKIVPSVGQRNLLPILRQQGGRRFGKQPAS